VLRVGGLDTPVTVDDRVELHARHGCRSIENAATSSNVKLIAVPLVSPISTRPAVGPVSLNTCSVPLSHWQVTVTDSTCGLSPLFSAVMPSGKLPRGPDMVTSGDRLRVPGQRLRRTG